MTEMKVYRFNEYEWIAAPDPFSAVRWYFKETGVQVEEGLDEDAHELTDAEMDTMIFVDREGDFGEDGGEDGGEYTFREALGKMLASHAALGKDDGRPFFFAGTEY